MSAQHHRPRPTGGAQSTIKIRLALEAEADRLADLEAEALERWRTLSTQRTACELALRELPDIIPEPATAEKAA